jgi:hypothetical protein
MLSTNEIEDIAQLLPFYVNGTLSAKDCARVDKAIASSGDLRAELALVGNLAQLVKAEGHEMTQGENDVETRLDAVLARIEEKPPQAAPQKAVQDQSVSRVEPSSTSIGALLGFLNPKRWHPAVSLGLMAAFIAQGVALSSLGSSRQEAQAQIASLQKRVGDLEFELASGPEGEHRGNIILEVKSDVPWSAVESLLGKEGLSIVGGPSDGAITLSSEAKGATLDAQIKRIRSSPLIASVDKAA